MHPRRMYMVYVCLANNDAPHRADGGEKGKIVYIYVYWIDAHTSNVQVGRGTATKAIPFNGFSVRLLRT